MANAKWIATQKLAAAERLARAKPTEIVHSASDLVTGQPGSTAQLKKLSQDVLEHARKLLGERKTTDSSALIEDSLRSPVDH
jgi:hypothetical protein